MWPTITSTYRSLAEQAALRKEYEEGLRTGRPRKWPANKPGDSAHNYGLAVDSWVPDEWMDLWAAYRRAAGFTVPANDIIHAEVPNWRDFVVLKRF